MPASPPNPTAGPFVGPATINRIAGTGTPGSPVSGAALSAVFATAVGVTVAPDGDTAYVLEGGWDVPGTGLPPNTVRKITGLRTPSSTTVGGVWGTVPGSFGIASGQIRVGPATGRVYVTQQVGTNSGSIGTCQIGYFNPDGSWGGTILDSPVPILSGFDFTADEQTFFYSWTASSNPGNWFACQVGRKDVGGAQTDFYVTIDDILGHPFFGPGGAFQGSAGVWLDEPNGNLWFTSTGDFTKQILRCQVLPIYANPASNLFLSANVGGDMSGVQGFPNAFGPGRTLIAAIGQVIDHGGSLCVMLGDPTTGVGVYAVTGLDEYEQGDGYGWGETMGGGFMGAANGRLYYPTQGAIWELYLGGGWVGSVPLDGPTTWTTVTSLT